MKRTLKISFLIVSTVVGFAQYGQSESTGTVSTAIETPSQPYRFASNASWGDIAEDLTYVGLSTAGKQDVVNRFFSGIISNDTDYLSLSDTEKQAVKGRVYSKTGFNPYTPVSLLSEKESSEYQALTSSKTLTDSQMARVLELAYKSLGITLVDKWPDSKPAQEEEPAVSSTTETKAILKVSMRKFNMPVGGTWFERPNENTYLTTDELDEYSALLALKTLSQSQVARLMALDRRQSIAAASDDETVYIILGGNEYHHRHCSKLAGVYKTSSFPIPLGRARLAYFPCSKCR